MTGPIAHTNGGAKPGGPAGFHGYRWWSQVNEHPACGSGSAGPHTGLAYPLGTRRHHGHPQRHNGRTPRLWAKAVGQAQTP